MLYSISMAKFSRKRLFLVILAACFAFAAISAEVFILTHIEHPCCGEECPVCLQIEIAQDALKGLGLAGAAVFGLVFTLNINRITEKLRPCFICLPTPVALNVKSNT
ncbi:MAG: hypothetical protein LBQ57_12105 [Spirochaetales bacterium]|jgi:hypothetical protein|nr:hypothetical protein [Spirochaetales bacterium]